MHWALRPSPVSRITFGLNLGEDQEKGFHRNLCDYSLSLGENLKKKKINDDCVSEVKNFYFVVKT